MRFTLNRYYSNTTLKDNPNMKKILLLVCSTLFLSSCQKNETWLRCKENLNRNPASDKEFFLKIVRQKGLVSGEYFDHLNKTSAKIKETDFAFIARMGIYQHIGSRGYSQLTVRINRENLSYSKTLTAVRKDAYSKWEDIGGISIENAGSCQVMKNPPRKII